MKKFMDQKSLKAVSIIYNTNVYKCLNQCLVVKQVRIKIFAKDNYLRGGVDSIMEGNFHFTYVC
jgi:hypothetical protein